MAVILAIKTKSMVPHPNHQCLVIPKNLFVLSRTILSNRNLTLTLTLEFRTEVIDSQTSWTTTRLHPRHSKLDQCCVVSSDWRAVIGRAIRAETRRLRIPRAPLVLTWSILTCRMLPPRFFISKYKNEM